MDPNPLAPSDGLVDGLRRGRGRKRSGVHAANTGNAANAANAAHTPHPPGHLLPRLKVPYSHARLALTLSAAIAYALAFLALHPLAGGRVTALTLVPVAVAGWLLGRRAGVWTALATVPLNALLFALAGRPAWELALEWPNVLIALIAGPTFGWMSESFHAARWLSSELRVARGEVATARAEVADLLRRFVPRVVADQMMADPQAVQLGGQCLEVTILFADLRGFTRWTETRDPELTLAVLNQHMAVGIDAIVREGGTLDKIMGDALMAVFNAPHLQPDHALRAVRAAQAILAGTPPDSTLRFSIGINTGLVVAGNIGTEHFMNYTVIGDAVNQAKRLQEMARRDQALISESTYEHLQRQYEARLLGRHSLRGRKGEVLVYDLTSLHLPDLRDGLTGLYGRAYLEAALERELRQGAREQYPVVVLLAAPDQFQRINRTLGQAAGEALLHALGNFFSMRTRGEDMACHYAGEKFALVLPGATPEAVRRFVEQLQSNLKHLRVRHHDRALDPLTLSFGVAVFPEHGATGAAVLGAAEAALDRARRAGRERVVVGGAAAAITGAAEDEGDEDGGGDEDGDVPLA